MKSKKSSELYGVIGLGRFGFALAQSLADSGKDVLVVDSDEHKVRKATAFTDNAYVVGDLTKENLEEIGVQNCDTVVVCIGERIDTSILTTLTVLQLGVHRVISKATSAEQGSILEMMGAEVVYPERDMALRVAKKLIAPHVLEYISLSGDTDISEIALTAKESGRTIEYMNLRKRFGLNIIAVRRADKLETEIDPHMSLQEGDLLIVVGKNESINKFEEYLDS